MEWDLDEQEETSAGVERDDVNMDAGSSDKDDEGSADESLGGMDNEGAES